MSIVIIGTGLAGYSLAREFRKLDTTTSLTLITEDDGSFYSKPLLSTALDQQKTPDQLVMSTVEKMAGQLNATILTHTRVDNIDLSNKTVQCNDQSIHFSRLVLACGAEKITPLLEGDAQAAICSVNNLTDYRVFRDWLENKKKIAVMGAGLVGCELANDLLNAGFSVDLFAPDDYPLKRFVPESIGQALIEGLRKVGLQWHLGKSVMAASFQDSRIQLRLSDDSTFIADGVLMAVGIKPNVMLAKAAGLTIHRGIVVDHYLQTSAPDIYALGDCAEVDGALLQYVAPLLQCARALAKTLAGNEASVDYPHMPIVVKTPACPIATLMPPADLPGEWRVDGESIHRRALFYDNDGRLRGFALAGDTVRERAGLVRQL